jgi:hypothetical protein
MPARRAAARMHARCANCSAEAKHTGFRVQRTHLCPSIRTGPAEGKRDRARGAGGRRQRESTLSGQQRPPPHAERASPHAATGIAGDRRPRGASTTPGARRGQGQAQGEPVRACRRRASAGVGYTHVSRVPNIPGTCARRRLSPCSESICYVIVGEWRGRMVAHHGAHAVCVVDASRE